ncbi:MAG: hypothetical protein FWC97_05775 [Treponema sp.]|nr:hypothetical protein [Treponema sp.]
MEKQKNGSVTARFPTGLKLAILISFAVILLLGSITALILRFSRNDVQIFTEENIEISPETIQIETPIEPIPDETAPAAPSAPAAVRETTPAPAIPPELLPAAQNLQPATGRRFSMNDLLEQRNITFTWQPVQGANAYMFTVFRQEGSARQQLYHSQPISRTEFILEDLRLLDVGTFIWQVEAVNRTSDGTIARRGNIAESSFVMDIILPGAIQVDGTGVAD